MIKILNVAAVRFVVKNKDLKGKVKRINLK